MRVRVTWGDTWVDGYGYGYGSGCGLPGTGYQVRVRVSRYGYGYGYGYGLPGAILGQAFVHSAVITPAPHHIILLGKSKT